MKPVISVVVPAYNEGKYIKKCLESLASQVTDIPFEIIVVDNDSTDDTADIARRFPVRLITEKRRGPGHTRNRGAIAARGDILAYVDADYVVRPHHIQAIHDAYRNNPGTDILAGGYVMYDATPLFVQITKSGHAFGAAFGIIKAIFGVQYLTGGNFAVRKSALLSVGGFRPVANVHQGDDIDLSVRLRLSGYKARFVRGITAFTSARRFINLNMEEQKSRYYWFFRHLLSYRVASLRAATLPRLRGFR